jgi:hypothetical protein
MIPVTTPEVELMVATAIALLDQTPPPAALIKVVVVPGQAFDVPVIGTGAEFTDNE